MAKTSGGLRGGGSGRVTLYGRTGYALFNSKGEQVTRALFGFQNSVSKGFRSGKAEAENTLSNYKKRGIGNGYKIGKARNRYGE